MGKRTSNCRRATRARQCPKEDLEKSAGLHAVQRWWRIRPSHWRLTEIVSASSPLKLSWLSRTLEVVLTCSPSFTVSRLTAFLNKAYFSSLLKLAPHLLAEWWADEPMFGYTKPSEYDLAEATEALEAILASFFFWHRQLSRLFNKFCSFLRVCLFLQPDHS